MFIAIMENNVKTYIFLDLNVYMEIKSIIKKCKIKSILKLLTPKNFIAYKVVINRYIIKIIFSIKYPFFKLSFMRCHAFEIKIGSIIKL